MPIRRLDPLPVDRIAAGEVIERPAAAVKELVENALDAGAKRIEVAIEAGGRRLIRVADDGRGMDEADLALSRRAARDVENPRRRSCCIATFGFRGEALPSIASVSRLEIRTRTGGAPNGLKIVVEEGVKGAIEPCASSLGTRVEARDLFAATPARLKFLKSDRAEAIAIADVVKRLAMAAPEVRFSLTSDIGSGFDWPAAGSGEAGRDERLRQALGDEFAANSLALEAGRDGVRLLGRVGLPTYSRPNALQQFVFVNGRAVRDKTLAGALRALTSISCPPTGMRSSRSSSNASRARSTSTCIPPRPRCAFAIRAWCAGSSSARSSSAWAKRCTAPRPPAGRRRFWLCARRRRTGPRASARWDWRASPAAPRLAEPAQAGFAELAVSAPTPAAPANERDLAAPLGAARAQVHGTYIIAQTNDGLVIVDQHAAHERIVYEKLKRERDGGVIERQTLLTPLVVDLDPDVAALVDAHAEELAGLGLIVEGFGPGAVLVREAPAMIAQGDLAGLVRDLAADLAAEDGAQSLARRLDRWLGTFACRHSVRVGPDA